MIWPSGVLRQKVRYRVTWLGVARDLQTSQTTSIMTSDSVVSLMQNLFGTALWKFLVMSFQCNQQAVHIVPCTGSTRWRYHKPPRCDTVLLRMGTSSHSHYKSTAGGNPARLKCLFVVKDAESSVEGLVALVQTFATGPIRQTAGMVIVQERCQHPMQPLHIEGYSRKSLFVVGTTHIIHIPAIQAAMPLFGLMLQPDGSQWYLTNTIDFNAFNVFLMKNILLHAWSNRSSAI